MKKWLFILVICLIIFSSCAFNSSLKEGEIINKRFYQAHYIQNNQFIRTEFGTQTIISETYVPDKYVITIANSGDIKKILIYKQLYDSLSIGDWYII